MSGACVGASRMLGRGPPQLQQACLASQARSEYTRYLYTIQHKKERSRMRGPSTRCLDWHRMNEMSALERRVGARTRKRRTEGTANQGNIRKVPASTTDKRSGGKQAKGSVDKQGKGALVLLVLNGALVDGVCPEHDEQREYALQQAGRISGGDRYCHRREHKVNQTQEARPRAEKHHRVFAHRGHTK